MRRSVDLVSLYWFCLRRNRGSEWETPVVCAMFTEVRESSILDPDRRVCRDYETERDCVTVVGGRWLIAGFIVSGEGAETSGGWDTAHELLDSALEAILQGNPGFDVVAFLNTPSGG